jgi:hypothetical protein
MTPSDAARLSALEARERARDAALWKLAVAQIKSHHSLSDHRQPWEHLRNTVAPPSPPAAEGEAVPMPEPRIEDRWITEARQVYAAIAVFGWEITWKHYKAVPDDAWPIDIIAKALRAAATRATPGPSGKELAYDDMEPDMMRLHEIGQRLGWPAGELTLACAADALERMHATSGPTLVVDKTDLRAALAHLRRLAAVEAELVALRERIASAIEALDRAPDFGLVTEPSRKQALAIQEANCWAWTILNEGRDPPSRRRSEHAPAAAADEGE